MFFAKAPEVYLLVGGTGETKGGIGGNRGDNVVKGVALLFILFFILDMFIGF